MVEIKCHICGKVFEKDADENNFNLYSFCAHLVEKHNVNFFGCDPKEVRRVIVELMEEGEKREKKSQTER
jgi:hypothetical protein